MTPPRTSLTVINSAEIGAVLETAIDVVKEPKAVGMLIAIAFEYSLLVLESDPERRDQIREVTLKEAKEQARQFRARVLAAQNQPVPVRKPAA